MRINCSARTCACELRVGHNTRFGTSRHLVAGGISPGIQGIVVCTLIPDQKRRSRRPVQVAREIAGVTRRHVHQRDAARGDENIVEHPGMGDSGVPFSYLESGLAVVGRSRCYIYGVVVHQTAVHHRGTALLEQRDARCIVPAVVLADIIPAYIVLPRAPVEHLSQQKAAAIVVMRVVILHDTVVGAPVEIKAEAIAGAGAVITETFVVLYGYAARIVHPYSAGSAAVYVASAVIECHTVLNQASIGIAQHNSVAPDGIRIGYTRIIPGSTMSNGHVFMRIAHVIIESDIAVHQYAIPEVVVHHEAVQDEVFVTGIAIPAPDFHPCFAEIFHLQVVETESPQFDIARQISVKAEAVLVVCIHPGAGQDQIFHPDALRVVGENTVTVSRVQGSPAGAVG